MVALMNFIVMDLLGNFKPLPQGHHLALTIIDIMMNYTWYIPLCTKEADEIVQTYYD